MCASSHPLGASTAVNVLRQGGNAIDAAVSAVAVHCVVEPDKVGIGGDNFTILKKPGEQAIGYNGSGRAGQAADADWLKTSGLKQIAADSVHSITVPGAIDAWDRLLKDHGTITLGEALQPAIEFAENGYPVSPRVAWDWSGLVDKLKRDEGATKHYLIDGKAPEVGQVLTAPALAASLREIARQGRDAFYAGVLTDDIVTTLQAKGSLLSHEDFAATQGEYVTPLSTSYGEYDLLENPPNGQGATALILLNIFNHLDFSNLDPAGAGRFHLQVEATRLAYEVRNRYIADPKLADVPLEKLLDPAFAERLAAEISPRKRIADPVVTVNGLDSNTVYLTVVDKDRMAVSFINSLFQWFGSGIVTVKTGISLHNRGHGFVTDPAHPNCIAPGKRPLHTIIPAMLMRNGEAVMPFGVMGGHYQAAGHAHFLSNIIDFGMDVQEALDGTRAFYMGDQLCVEQAMPEATITGLQARGHEVVAIAQPHGGGQAILIDWKNGALAGGSDPRKDGQAYGY
jgi:gamma-glutamyltranspeptidase / glutathione hydrolase